MANYSNTHTLFYGSKRNLNKFLKTFFNESHDNVNYDYFDHEADGVVHQNILHKEKPAFYFGGIFKNSSPIDAFVNLANHHNLEFVIADCYEGYHTTIYHSNPKDIADTLQYKHDIIVYLKEPEKIDLVKPFNILQKNELIWGALHFNILDYLEQPHILKKILNPKFKQKFINWSKSLADQEEHDNIPDPFQGSPLTGLDIAFWDGEGSIAVNSVNEKFLDFIDHQKLKKIIKKNPIKKTNILKL